MIGPLNNKKNKFLVPPLRSACIKCCVRGMADETHRVGGRAKTMPRKEDLGSSWAVKYILYS